MGIWFHSSGWGRGAERSSAEEGPQDPEPTPSTLLGGLAWSAFQELGVEWPFH